MENIQVKLDAKDRKILSELDMDARQPLSKIAKKVRLSREVVNYRIKQLEKRGVIEGYYTVIDITKLGMIYCRVFLKYRQITKEKEKELMDYYRKSPAITWVALLQGKWDVGIIFTVKSIEEFEAAYDELLNNFGNYLQNPYISIAFKIYHFPNTYLYNTKERKCVVLGQKSEALPKIDTLDKALLNIISGNANESLINLSKKLSSTPKIISYRLKRLVKEKVILAFRAKINTALFGYGHHKVYLNLQKMSKTDTAKIISYLENQPNVIYITKPMGTFNLEFEIMIKGSNKLFEFMKEFLYHFSDIVINYETVLYYREPTLTYLPFGKL